MGAQRGGRPQLDNQEGFTSRLCEVLPRLKSGDISQRRAAEVLGISVRSLNSYARRTAADRTVPEKSVSTPEIEAVRKRSALGAQGAGKAGSSR